MQQHLQHFLCFVLSYRAICSDQMTVVGWGDCFISYHTNIRKPLVEPTKLIFLKKCCRYGTALGVVRKVHELKRLGMTF